MTTYRSCLGPGRRIVALLMAMTLLTFGMVVVGSMSSAQADTDPPAGTPSTVSADSLATWQINGVVWSQVTIGDTVYAAGEFSQARPPGVAQGGAGSVNVGNLIAYNITTGNLIASFNHTLNAQALVVTKSPDNSRIYVGGDFTTVDGQARGHIAAFDVATGALDTSFQPNISSTVHAIAVSNSTVYAGGAFDYANGTYRHHLAAMNASNGATTGWSPKTDNYIPWTMIMTPDQSKVVIGGSFQQLNGQTVDGLAAVDPTQGNLVPWAATTEIPDAINGAIMGLSTDGTNIYGSGWAFGSGASFEGEFSLNPSDGSINWLNDCQGDTYDTYPMNGALYTVSHVHNCEMIGGLTQLSDWGINQRHALAFSTTSSGQKNKGPDQYGWDYRAYDHSDLLTWYPNFSWGNYTNQGQSGWSITGNGDYLAIGGEFQSVNGKAQYGLVRFAVKGKAPNKMGPAACYDAPAPTARSVAGGTARVSWQAATDPDNADLTYKVYRSGTTAPVYTTTQSNQYWNCPQMGYVDKGLTAGSSYTYRVTASDAYGNTYNLPTTNSVTIAGGTLSNYAQDVLNDNASAFWRLGESSGSAVYDWSGFNDATAQSGVSRGTSGPIAGDSTTASTFSGSSSGYAATNSTMATTPSFSIETWIKTTTRRGGKIVGYGSSNTGNSSSYDRHIYMDNSGHINFGVYPGSTQVITSPKTYNDGDWHYIVASLDATRGMTLYVDGKKVSSNPGVTTAQDYTGYWRIGGDNLGSWPNTPTSSYFSGSIGDVAIYPTALSLAQVQTHYTDGGGTLDIPPAPTDSYGKAVYNSNPDLFWRLDDANGPTAADASRNGETGVYSGGVTYGQPGALGNQGTAVTFDGSDGTIGSTDKFNDPTVYSEELWFNTTTTSGGKLIGFGDQQSGDSSSYDRHVYMTADGKLNFGTWTGAQNVITSPDAYNDGKWHYMVATQGPDGMKLYVDGQEVANGTQTAAQDYAGYWRVGGDTSWDGSNYFAGSIDEVAVYPSELDAATVQAHYAAGGGTLPNKPPVAAFTSSVQDLSATFNSDGSMDPDGTIMSYSWSFGDNTPAVDQANPTHEYASAGTYQVTLTVTDDDQATTSVTHDVTVTGPPPANVPPVAAFTSHATNLEVDFDGTGSKDSDGSIVSYAWTFGDNATSAAESPTHTYTSAGTYTVTLTVTDNGGATDEVSKDITVTAAQSPAIAMDDFGRTVSNGWGTADTGGNWSVQGGAGNFAVANSTGQITLTPGGAGPAAYLRAVSATNVDMTVDLKLDKVPDGSSVYAYLPVRIDGSDNYQAKIRLLNTGQVQVYLTKVVGGAETTLAGKTVSGVTSGDTLQIRLQATGTSPTTLSAAVWKLGTTEPDTWTVSATDSESALQSAGSLGLKVYASGSVTNTPIVASFSNLAVYAPGQTPPANKAPAAAFSASVKHLAATFDSSASSDPDGGTITGYKWEFGDGETSDQANPTHAYSTAGSYSAKLTVTDNDGATDSKTIQVVASAAGAVPKPDHVVVVVEENRAESNIIGDSAAPYINSLAASGANMTNSFAETHPSQPNYLALFSGSTQGVTDDSCITTDFTTPSLYDQLKAAGNTFTGYSEGLPSAGYTGCSSGDYVRKHNPWVNWSSVPGSANQPFSAFPTDYSKLPDVSFVIPNLQNDMHDGTIAQGDTWLQQNLGDYVTWAKTHNSLLVLTWDEDDNTALNQIPTVIVGQGVKPGNYTDQINHYNVLRTLQDAFGLGTIGASTGAAPITSIWGAAVNQAPVAAFSHSESGLTSTFTDTSSDPDGDSLSYAWDFGDGDTSTDKSPAPHTYTKAGTYTVKLTVTDPGGLSDSVSHDVDVTAQAPTVLASDGFQRTVASGWGSLDQGGNWSTSGSGISVNGSAGLFGFSTAGRGMNALASSVSTTQSDVHVKISTDGVQPTGSLYVYVVGRSIAGVGDYRAKVMLRSDGQVYLAVSRMDGNTEVAAVPLQRVSGLTYTAGESFNVRFDVTGTSPTTLQAKIWADGTDEPDTWQIEATDDTASMQAAGRPGVSAYLSGNATGLPLDLSFDDFKVVDASTLDAQAMKAMDKGVKVKRLTKVTKANAKQLHALSKWGKP